MSAFISLSAGLFQSHPFWQAFLSSFSLQNSEALVQIRNLKAQMKTLTAWEAMTTVARSAVMCLHWSSCNLLLYESFIVVLKQKVCEVYGETNLRMRVCKCLPFPSFLFSCSFPLVCTKEEEELQNRTTKPLWRAATTCQLWLCVVCQFWSIWW